MSATRPLEVDHGVGGPAQRHERGAEIAVGLGMVRIDRQDLIILSDRGVGPALIRQNVGKVEAGHGQIRAHRNRALVTRDRVGQAALLAAHIAEIEMRQRVIGAQRHGTLQMRRHVIVAAERAPRQRDVVMIFGNRVVDLDRLVEQLHRGRCVAALERDETEIVQAVGMVRREVKNVPVLPLGLDQRSGLMMGNSGIEQGRGRIRRVGGDAERRLGARRSKASPLFAAHGFIDGSVNAGHSASEPAQVGQFGFPAVRRLRLRRLTLKCRKHRYFGIRRGGRVAEGGGLLNRYTV